MSIPIRLPAVALVTLACPISSPLKKHTLSLSFNISLTSLFFRQSGGLGTKPLASNQFYGWRCADIRLTPLASLKEMAWGDTKGPRCDCSLSLSISLSLSLSSPLLCACACRSVSVWWQGEGVTLSYSVFWHLLKGHCLLVRGGKSPPKH